MKVCAKDDEVKLAYFFTGITTYILTDDDVHEASNSINNITNFSSNVIPQRKVDRNHYVLGSFIGFLSSKNVFYEHFKQWL